jgi:hypothetical protein
MEITLENARKLFRADRNVPMHQIKPGLRRQDLKGIHLPSFRFSLKLKKLCRVDVFVFESWHTAAKSQGKAITSSAVCHDSKTKKLLESGFMPNDSTSNQLLQISNDILNSFENGMETMVVFMDISKAFDRVRHRGMLVKLENNGINGSLLRWFENYLYGRS